MTDIPCRRDIGLWTNCFPSELYFLGNVLFEKGLNCYRELCLKGNIEYKTVYFTCVDHGVLFMP